jgi:nicotinate-nucleotide adenylyltransferase
VAARPGAQPLRPDDLAEPLKSEVLKRQAASSSVACAAGSVQLRQMTPLDISATAIRDTLARHGSARYLLPDAVLDYIHEHQLYAHTYEH